MMQTIFKTFAGFFTLGQHRVLQPVMSIKHKLRADSRWPHCTAPVASNLCFSLEKFMSVAAVMFPFFGKFLPPL